MAVKEKGWSKVIVQIIWYMGRFLMEEDTSKKKKNEHIPSRINSVENVIREGVFLVARFSWS